MHRHRCILVMRILRSCVLYAIILPASQLSKASAAVHLYHRLTHTINMFLWKDTMEFTVSLSHNIILCWWRRLYANIAHLDVRTACNLQGVCTASLLHVIPAYHWCQQADRFLQACRIRACNQSRTLIIVVFVGQRHLSLCVAAICSPNYIPASCHLPEPVLL